MLSLLTGSASAVQDNTMLQVEDVVLGMIL